MLAIILFLHAVLFETYVRLAIIYERILGYKPFANQ